MADKTPEEIAHERTQLIASLGPKDFSQLSSAQFSMVQQAQLENSNARAVSRVNEMLKDKVEDVARSMSETPFVFRSEPVKIMAGCTARFMTLITAQVRDAHKRLDEFIHEHDPNNLRSSDFLNRELLAHALFEFNGSEFGGVDFDHEEYRQMRSSNPEDAAKMLAEVRNKRLEAIDDLSPHIVDRLVEYYRAFQVRVDEIAKSDEMDEALGN